MGTYKVLQDIEGEDHLILWLTPKQTIYAAITIVACVLAFMLGKVNIVLGVPWLIPIIFFGFLAAPLGKDQPNDVWAIAQLRFHLKNRKRIWDQSGMQELVHITVPKRAEKIYTDGLDQGEVRSRLRALSTTIDSRGWAIKNSTINLSNSPQFNNQFTQASDDRLLGSDVLEQDVPNADVTAADDIMDQVNNSVAQRFDEQIKKQAEDHKNMLRRTMLLPQSEPAVTRPAAVVIEEQLSAFAGSELVAPGSVINATVVNPSIIDDSDKELLEKIHHDQAVTAEITAHSHEKIVKTAEQMQQEQEAERQRLMAQQDAEKARANTAPDVILKELSQSELKISTIAAQAQHKVEASNKDGEVVVSLH